MTPSMDRRKWTITIIICLFLYGCDRCDDNRPQPVNFQPYHIDYSISPSNVRRHIKWVGVPGGQFSIDRDDQIIEFVGYGGKRYFYKESK